MADPARRSQSQTGGLPLPVPERFRRAIGPRLMQRIARHGPQRLAPPDLRRLEARLAAFTDALDRDAAEIERQSQELAAVLDRLSSALRAAGAPRTAGGQ